MALKALITLDLDGVNNKQRTDFYDYLEEKKFFKIPNIDTAWKCSFNNGTTRSDAIEICKSIIKQAGNVARVTSAKSVIQVGEGNVEEF